MRIAIAPELLVAYLLALARASAWVAISPPFGNKLVPSGVKIGFAASLALVMGPTLKGSVPAFDTAPFISAIVMQVAAGAALGYLGVLIFSAVQGAGSLIDLFGGFTAAQLFDPMSNAGASVFGRLYYMVGITVLFAINGHILIVRGLLTSFEAAPLTSFSLDAMRATVVTGIGRFLLSAIEIAAPLLAALFLAEVVLGLLSRAAPQLNVIMLGMPLKALLTITLGGVALPLIPDATRALLTMIIHAGQHVT